MKTSALWYQSGERVAALPGSIELEDSIDTHVHLRNSAKSGDGRMEIAVKECAAEHEAVVAIGNSAPEITNGKEARAYRAEAESHIPPGQKLKILVAPLVGDDTDPEMVRQAWDKPDGEEDFHALKIFFEKVSNAKKCVTSIWRIEQLIKSVTRGLKHKKNPIPITFHAESFATVLGEQLPIAEREWHCIENIISKAVRINPGATFVIRHASDGRTVEWVAEQYKRGLDIHLEICPQYFLKTEDDLFIADDGRAALQCNCICWPRFKDEWSRKAMEDLVLAGHDWVHFGSDYAMHIDDPTKPSGVKITSQGEAVGGLNFLPWAAKSLVIDLFLAAGKTAEDINKFMSRNAASLYGVQLSGRTHRYVRQDTKVPEYTFGTKGDEEIKSVCFLRGETMHWKRAD